MRNLLSSLIPVLFLLGLPVGVAWAGNNDGENNDGGGAGRDAADEWIAEQILLRLPEDRVENIVQLVLAKLGQGGSAQGSGGGSSASSQVLLEAKIVSVTYKNINKLDLSDIPFFGGLVGPEFNADDMTEENKVGNAFSTEDGGLFVALDEAAFGGRGSAEISRIIVFNENVSQEIKPLRLNFVPNITRDGKVMLDMIGQLAELESVQTALPEFEPAEVGTNLTVYDGSTILLGGLTREEVERDQNQVPFLDDLPILRALFRGTTHWGENNELLILIKPSVLVQ